MGLRLVIEDMEGATTIVPLDEQEVTIGRKDHNTIQLTEQNVSRSHARLKLEADSWCVEDLSSYNGVKVNGVPIGERTPLREGDLLQIGDYHLKLTDNVDRETVDLGGPRAAANQGESEEDAKARAPALVSSSAELPAMSEAELAAQGVGAGTTGSAAALDGPDEPDEETKSKAGIIIGVLVGAILLVGGGAYMMSQNAGMTGTPETPGHDNAVASAGAHRDRPVPEPGPEAEPAPAGEPTDTVGAEDGEAPAAGETAGAGTDGDGDGDVAVDGPEPDPELEPDPDPDLEADPPTPTKSGPEPQPAKPDPSNKKKKKKKANGDVPPPPQAAADPEQLLADARKASLAGDAAKAYELASKSYKAKKTSKALQLMVVNACNMGSKSKAVAAFKKMKSSKDVLKSHCASKGIEL